MYRPGCSKYIDLPCDQLEALTPKDVESLAWSAIPGECRDKYPKSNLEACFGKSLVMFDVYEFVLLSAFYEIAF